MRKIILALNLILFVFTCNAQTCDDIQDISHKNCHVIDTVKGCKHCNYPQWQSMKSWYDGKVVEFTTAGINIFLRFYSGNREGSWMVKAKDICVDGRIASFEEAKEILQLTDAPDSLVIVDIPGGTVMLEGRIYGSTCDSCRQFCVEDKLDKDCFISINDKMTDCSF